MVLLGDEQPYLKFSRAANTCVECGADLRQEEQHPSTLPVATDDAEVDADSDALPPMRREDYCATCWPKVRENGYFSFWLTRRRPDARLKQMERRARKARLLDLFDRLDVAYHAQPGEAPSLEDLAKQAGDMARLDAATPEGRENLEAFLYVVAHMLLHYNVLAWIREEPQPKGEGILVFGSSTFGREFRVPNSSPHHPVMESAQTALEQFLAAEDGGGAATRKPARTSR